MAVIEVTEKDAEDRTQWSGDMAPHTETKRQQILRNTDKEEEAI